MKCFKDTFGKEATDLNKKEFYDSKKQYSYKLKSASNGVTFEGNSGSGKEHDLNINFKDKDMEVKNKIDNNAVFTVETTLFNVADNVNAGFKFVTPKADDTGKRLFSEVQANAAYTTADLNSKLTLAGSFAEDSIAAPNGLKISAEVSSKVMDDVVAGLNIVDLTPSGDAKSIDLGVVHSCGDMKVCGHFLATAAAMQPKADKMTASLFHKASKDTTVAGEFELDSQQQVTLKFGTSFAMGASSTLKSKISTVCTEKSKKPSLDFAWVQKFDGKSLTLQHNYSTEGASTFGLSASIDV